MYGKGHRQDYLLTTHRSQQTWCLQSAEHRMQKKNYTNYRKKILQSCLHIFSTNLKLPRTRYRKNVGIKSEAIHSLTEKRVPKLVYYHSSNFGVPTLNAE